MFQQVKISRCSCCGETPRRTASVLRTRRHSRDRNQPGHCLRYRIRRPSKLKTPGVTPVTAPNLAQGCGFQDSEALHLQILRIDLGASHPARTTILPPPPGPRPDAPIVRPNPPTPHSTASLPQTPSRALPPSPLSLTDQWPSAQSRHVSS